MNRVSRTDFYTSSRELSTAFFDISFEGFSAPGFDERMAQFPAHNAHPLSRHAELFCDGDIAFAPVGLCGIELAPFQLPEVATVSVKVEIHFDETAGGLIIHPEPLGDLRDGQTWRQYSGC
jgi:hypothetical protein